MCLCIHMPMYLILADFSDCNWYLQYALAPDCVSDLEETLSWFCLLIQDSCTWLDFLAICEVLSIFACSGCDSVVISDKQQCLILCVCFFFSCSQRWVCADRCHQTGSRPRRSSHPVTSAIATYMYIDVNLWCSTQTPKLHASVLYLMVCYYV